MKIEKINDNQIRCILSKKDLDNRNIKINELAYGNLKVRELFSDMLHQALVQYGFDTHNMPLIIEAIPIENDKIILNISRVDEPDELDTRFSRFSPLRYTGDASNNMNNKKNIDVAHFKLDTVANKLKMLDENLDDKMADFPDSFYFTAYFFFDNLKDVIKSAKLISSIFEGNSRLVKLNNDYIMMLQKQNMSGDVFNYICNIMADCGCQADLTFPKRMYISQKSKILIDNFAIQKLSESFN